MTSHARADSAGTPLQTEAVRTLLRENAFGHAVSELRLIETAISWVVLTGPYAYKLKKPVNYGFLDFSTLDRRKHYCEEEVRLNGRFAPELYLGVVPVTVRDGLLRIGGEGEVVDFAVRMRQFEEAALLSREIESGVFGPAQAEELGRWLATMHRQLPARPAPSDGEPGSPESFLSALRQNFLQIRPRLPDEPRRRRLAETEEWALRRYREIEVLLRRRAANGWVRESHGDLHLRNVVRLDGRLVPFDCIEFNEHFRVMDLQAELSMLVMDIERRGRRLEAAICFNACLEESGDYDGVETSDLFRCYYALVRAKVALFETKWPEFDGYMALARAYCEPRQPALWLMHGFSGSGKTTVAGQMLAQLDGVRLRSDVERKRLFGVAPTARSGATGLHEAIYAPAATNAAYDRLERLARIILRSGRHCIVDAAFLDAGHRSRFACLAADLHLPCHIVSCEAGAEILRTRLARRAAATADASEAGLEVLAYQLLHHDPLSPAERAASVAVDTDAPAWNAELAAALARLAG